MKITSQFDTDLLINTLLEKDHEVFTRPFELNIVGIRANSTEANSFDDQIQVLFYDDAGEPYHFIFNATTDPGTYWLKNPAVKQGTAILAQGQYRNAYQIGLHRGKYEALVQIKPVTVIRDYDRNAKLDFLNGRTETGMLGINLHHASSNGVTKTIDEYSAGCQVFADINDFNLFMRLCSKQKDLYGNVFTYTLIDQRALSRTRRRWITYGIAAVGGSITAGLLLYKLVKSK